MVGCGGDDGLTYYEIDLDTTYANEPIDSFGTNGYRVYCSDVGTYWVDLQNLDSDCDVSVFDSDGHQVGTGGSDFSDLTDEELSFTVTTADNYYIEVDEWDGLGSSEYDITVTPPSGIRPAPPFIPVTLNKTENTGKIKDKKSKRLKLNLN